MSDAEITALLDSMTNLRDLAMVLLMLDGGLRPGEVLGLHLEDIAYGRRRVTVRKRDTSLPTSLATASPRSGLATTYNEPNPPRRAPDKGVTTDQDTPSRFSTVPSGSIWPLHHSRRQQKFRRNRAPGLARPPLQPSTPPRSLIGTVETCRPLKCGVDVSRF